MNLIKAMSIKNRITLSFILFIIVPITFLCLYGYFQTQHYIRSQLINNGRIALTQIKYSMENKMEISESVSNNITYNALLQNFLAEPFEAPESLDPYQKDIVPMINYAMLYQKVNIKKILVYFNNYTIPEGYNAFFHDTKAKDSDWYRNFLRSDSKASWVRKESPEGTTYAFLQKIYSMSGRYLGVTSVDLFENDFVSPISNLPDGNSPVYLIDSTGQILYNDNNYKLKDTSFLLPFPESGSYRMWNEFAWITIPIANTDLRLVMALPSASAAGSIQLLTMVVVIAVTILMLTIFYLVLKIIFTKMKKSIQQMDFAIHSGFDQRLPVDRNDEFGVIAEKFNTLLEKISALMEDTINKGIAHKDAQLKALQLQISPHFIYNTIGLFSAKMELSGQYEVSEAFVEFGRMLRYNNESRSMYTTVDLELQYLQSYMSLQRLKYGDQLELTVRADEDLLAYPIIKFIFQPVVENSIKHGLMPHRKLNVQVEISRENSRILIVITDNGEGIPPDQLLELNRRLQERNSQIMDRNPSVTGSGIGLDNINDRLTLFYGNDYYVRIESVHGKYTRVILTIPTTE